MAHAASYIRDVVSNGTNFNLSGSRWHQRRNESDQREPETSTLTGSALDNSSTKFASRSNRPITFSPHARSQSDTPGVPPSWWPDTDCFAFVTSTADGKRDGRDVLGRGDTYDIQSHLIPILFAFACYVDVVTFLSTLFLLLIQFVCCSNDLFGIRRTHAQKYFCGFVRDSASLVNPV